MTPPLAFNFLSLHEGEEEASPPAMRTFSSSDVPPVSQQPLGSLEACFSPCCSAEGEWLAWMLLGHTYNKHILLATSTRVVVVLCTRHEEDFGSCLEKIESSGWPASNGSK